MHCKKCGAPLVVYSSNIFICKMEVDDEGNLDFSTLEPCHLADESYEVEEIPKELMCSNYKCLASNDATGYRIVDEERIEEIETPVV